MITRPLGKKDYDHIVQVIDPLVGRADVSPGPSGFLLQLGQCARVVEHDGILVGFLFGLIAQGRPRPATFTSSVSTPTIAAGALARCCIRLSRKSAARRAACA